MFRVNKIKPSHGRPWSEAGVFIFSKIVIQKLAQHLQNAQGPRGENLKGWVLVRL